MFEIIPGGTPKTGIQNTPAGPLMRDNTRQMSGQITLNAINKELIRLGYTARLAKASGYFYFHFGEAANWLDRTVQVPKVSSLTVPQWVEEYRRLKTLNEQIMRTPSGRKAGGRRRSGATG